MITSRGPEFTELSLFILPVARPLCRGGVYILPMVRSLYRGGVYILPVVCDDAVSKVRLIQDFSFFLFFIFFTQFMKTPRK